MCLDARLGVSTYVEVFILLGVVLGGTGFAYAVTARYAASTGGPSLSLASAAIRQGSNVAVGKVEVTNTGTMAIISFVLNAGGASTAATPLEELYFPSGATPVTSGLVGYWPLDEGSGSSTQDASGNLNTGSAFNGPSWTAGASCYYGNCLSFVGASSQYVGGSPADLQFELQSLTVCAWVYPTSLSFDEVFATNVFGVNTGFETVVDPSNNQAGFQYSSPSGYLTNTFTNFGGVAVNVWQHFCFTFSLGSMSLYKNGVLVSGLSNSHPTIQYSSGGWAFGALNGGSIYANERIDDLRVYGRVLSAGEVKQVYSPHQRCLGCESSGGLAGYWPLDEGSGSVASDYSGNMNTGTISGSPSPLRSTGKFGTALQFEPNFPSLANQGVDLGSGIQPFESGTQAISFTAWYYLPSVDAGSDNFPMLFGDTGGSPRNGYDVYVTTGSTPPAGRLVMERFSGGTLTALAISGVLSTGWHHVAAVYDGSTGRLYVDGALADTTVTDTHAIAPDSNLALGANGGASGVAGNYGYGTLDDFRVYGSALSASQVRDLGGATSLSFPIFANLAPGQTVVVSVTWVAAGLFAVGGRYTLTVVSTAPGGALASQQVLAVGA